jgi:hypothetical protein
MLMFSNCVKYNVGPNGVWFRNEADRQKKIWKEKTFPDAKQKLKAALTKRKNALAQSKSGESGGATAGSKKRKPPPPLAFAPVEKSGKGASGASNLSKEAKGGDSSINNLTVQDVEPLPPWRFKRRKKEVEIPSMQCLAAMLLADPFVMRILSDKVLRILRVDVVKGKCVPAGHPMLPSLFQLMNIAHMSMQLCVMKGRRYAIPDSGLKKNVMYGADLSLPYDSLRTFLPLVSKMLLDIDLDRRLVAGGDLHDAALHHPELATKEWEGSASLHGLKVVVEGTLVNLLCPGNSNEMALREQFPRFVAALDNLSGGCMLNERPFLMSMTHALLRYKSKLPHSTRDLVTGCMVKWLRMGGSVTPEGRVCSELHECFMNLLNEVRR